ncbi:MAG TPA: carboxypeptidase-like regulatory domain-containing protein [Edaphobacter sp.]|nr:carboxypeptidase-like regulatory domain-containing protein [Edaphobacter sp.]
MLCTLLMTAAGRAQQSSASVTGLVKDSTGANIAGAQVKLNNVETNVLRQTTSNGSGNYTFLNVPPGRYTLEFSAKGFQSVKINPFDLNVNQTVTLEGTLNVGSVDTSVSVEAEGASVESSTSELGSVIAQKQVHDLPLNGRNFTQLLTLTPGVIPISVGQNRTASNTAVTPGSDFTFPSVNGQGNRENYFMVDGMNDQQAWYNTYAVAPIIDSIQEFKVNSHNDAQFGQVSGGVINVATKAGTNAFHGSAWEYIRNNAFDARDHFQTTVTPYHQNQFGGTLGGPVWIPKLYNGRDKTFFFVAAEGFRYSKAQTSKFNVPTPEELNGDYSALLAMPGGKGQLYNPKTGQPFPNNQLVDENGKSMLDPAAVAYAKAVLPAPIVIPGDPTHNAQNSGATRTTQWNYSGRIDQNVGTKDFIFFRYSGQEIDSSSPASLLHLFNTSQLPSQQYGASWVHMFNPTTSLQVQYGRAHVELNSAAAFDIKNVIGIYGVDPSLSSFIKGLTLMPNLNVSGYFSGGENSNPSANLSSVHQYKATFSKTLGSHQLQAGGSWDQINYGAILRSGTITFGAAQTSGVDPKTKVASTGDASASFLLGYPNDANKRNINITERPGGIMSFYVQDSWKVTSRLTASYGLRYDRTFIPAYGKENTVGQQGSIETGDYDFNNGTYILQVAPPSCDERGHAPCLPAGLPEHVVVSPNKKILHDTTTNWGPRFGLAYRVNDKMAIRGAFGIFYDNWAAAIQLTQNYQGSWPDVATLDTGQINAKGQQYTDPHNPFGTTAAQLPPPTPFNYTDPKTGKLVLGTNNYYVDPKVKNPYSEQYNLGIQQQFGTSTVFSLNYVGSQSHRLDIGGYYNTGMPSPYPMYDKRRANQVGPNGPQQNGQLYGYMPAVKSWDRSIGNGNYNALQASFSKSMSGGLAYTASYTWSKAIDEGQSGYFGVEGNQLHNPYNIRESRSVAAYNIPQFLSVSVNYDLPIGKNRRWSTGNGVADYVLGNWQVNTVLQARSGQNYTITASGDIANTGNGNTYVRGLVLGNPKINNPSANEWFNTAAFGLPYATVDKNGNVSEDPTIGTGNSGRNNMQSQNFYNVDFSVFRQFPIKDNLHAEFRAEAFNVLNHTVLGTPNASVNAAKGAFGTITGTASDARLLQFAAKLVF